MRGVSCRWKRTRTLVAMTVVAAALSGLGCVSQARYDAALSDAQRARDEAGAKDRELAVEKEREAARAQELLGLDVRLREVSVMQAHLRQLQDLLAQNAALAELTLAELAASRAPAVDRDDGGAHGSKAQPEDMDVRRTAPYVRAEALKETLRAVQALVDSGQVKVTVRDGRVRFHLPRRLDELDPYSAPR